MIDLLVSIVILVSLFYIIKYSIKIICLLVGGFIRWLLGVIVVGTIILLCYSYFTICCWHHAINSLGVTLSPPYIYNPSTLASTHVHPLVRGLFVHPFFALSKYNTPNSSPFTSNTILTLSVSNLSIVGITKSVHFVMLISIVMVGIKIKFSTLTLCLWIKKIGVCG